MNVFLVGWSPTGTASGDVAAAAFAEAVVLREKLGLPSLDSWASPDGCVTVACLAHSSEQVPAARYLRAEPNRMALFAGLPFAWTGEHEADGVSCLDAEFFLNGDLASDELDGRFAAVRYDSASGVLETLTDRLGSYPVFAAEDGGTTWIGNAPFVVARAARKTEVDLAALGHFFTIGWSLGGASLWRGVDRLPRATLEIRRRDGRGSRRELLPAETLRKAFGGRPPMAAAGRVLTATVGALGQWPGRPNVVPVSAGRDSRVVLAAAVAAGLDFTSRTIAFPRAPGFPQTPDVVIGGEVVAALGRERRVVEPGEAGGLRWSARLVRQATHGLMSLLETGLVNRHTDDEPLEIIHSGAGGELSRGLLFAGDDPADGEIVDKILGTWVNRVPRPITTGDTVTATRAYVREWVSEHRALGFAPGDVPDLFWLLERMQCWVAPPQHLQELSNDTTAPLWSPRMLPYTFAGTSRSRRAEPLHYALLQELAPSLAAMRFDGLNPAWPTFPARSGRGRRQRAILLKAWNEARRRTTARRAGRRGSFDPLLAAARDEVVTAMATMEDHPVWRVLDPQRIRRLVSRELHTLDPRSQALLWRVTTLVAADLPLD